MQFQFYWPGWWRLLPHYYYLRDKDFGRSFRVNYFCFGPFQWCWYSYDR